MTLWIKVFHTKLNNPQCTLVYMIGREPWCNVQQRFSQNISLSTVALDIKLWLEMWLLSTSILRLKWLNDRRRTFKRRPSYGLQAVAVVVSQSECICSMWWLLGWLNVGAFEVRGDKANADFSLVFIHFIFHLLFRNEILMRFCACNVCVFI